MQGKGFEPHFNIKKVYVSPFETIMVFAGKYMLSSERKHVSMLSCG